MLPFLICLIIFYWVPLIEFEKYKLTWILGGWYLCQRGFLSPSAQHLGALLIPDNFIAFPVPEMIWTRLKCTHALVFLEFTLSPRTQANPKHEDFTNTSLHLHTLWWALDLTLSCSSFGWFLKALLSLSLASSVVSKLYPPSPPSKGKLGQSFPDDGPVIPHYILSSLILWRFVCVQCNLSNLFAFSRRVGALRLSVISRKLIV